MKKSLHPIGNFKRSIKWLAAICAMVSIHQSQAADLLEVNANHGTLYQANASGEDLLGLLKDMFEQTGAFSQLDGLDFQARLRYGDYENAMRFNVFEVFTAPPQERWQAQIVITGKDQPVHLTAPDRASLNEAVKNYFKDNASGDYAKFLKAMNAKSAFSVPDGNPRANTAVVANQTFSSFGQEDGRTNEEREDPQLVKQESMGLGFTADVGRFDANGVKGSTYSLPLFAKFKLTDRVGLHFNIPLNWTRIGDANIFNGGLNIGMPIRAVVRTKENPLHWQITPSTGANVAGSEELASGGLLLHGGLTSLLSYDFKHFSVSMGNHFSYHEGMELDLYGYSFDPGVQQEILKNGVRVSIPFAKRWVFDVYGIHTKFLESAAIDSYFTVGGEFGFRFSGRGAKKKSGYTKMGLYADMAENYTSAHLQFGSSWKF
jgi:hypothetical protein